MGRLIEQQAVIDCLNNTAKYYERKDADEWTKGIHYGLLHGLDNILDDVSPVEAIPKSEYEARLKADMVAMLKELKKSIEDEVYNVSAYNECLDCDVIDYEDANEIITEKINSLRGEKDETD